MSVHLRSKKNLVVNNRVPEVDDIYFITISTSTKKYLLAQLLFFENF
jgi:hypothetical protein